MKREKAGISIKAITAGIAVLIAFSFIAGGYQSYARGVSAGRENALTRDSMQQELVRLEDQPTATAIVSLGIMLVAVCLAGFIAAFVAKRSPVKHGVVVGGIYAAFLIAVSVAILASFDISITSLWTDGIKVLLAVPLAGLGGYLCPNRRATDHAI